MKRTSIHQQWLSAAAAGLALAFCTSSGVAAPDQILGSFDTDLTGHYVWGRGWGADTTVVWDAAGNGGGCVTAQGTFNSTNSDTPVCVYAVNAGNPWYHPLPTFDLTLYTAIEFDIKWNNDPTNIPLSQFNNPSGEPDAWSDTGLQIGAVGTNNANNIVITGMPIPAAAAGAWAHVVIPIDPTKPGLGEVYGLWIRKWICNPPANPGDWQTGHVITNDGHYQFYVDNVVLKGTDAPPPPPTISPLVKPVNGVAFIAASGGQYDRQEIRTVTTNYSWIGASGPVSYSIDIAKLGENNPNGFAAFFHFVPGGAATNNADSDWHEPNVLMWSIQNNADGSAWAPLRYKTNAPDSNGHLYDTGDLGGQGAPSCLGTWTITFDNDTNVTMKAPNGWTTTTNIPIEVIDIFKTTPGIQVNIGGTPGSPTRLGQMVVVTSAKFTGTPSPIDSSFLTAAPDPAIWTTLMTGTTYGVQPILPDSAYWIDWTLPANGYDLLTAAAVTGPWSKIPYAGYDVGTKHYMLLNQTNLPSVNSGYFKLYKQVASKLQILLPGESNAPGTATGKTGTPTQPENSMPYTFTVNAVDADWNIVAKVTDSITITCSEAIALLPPDAGLVGGTANFDITLFEAGPWTITATDVTDPSKTPATVTVTVP